MAKQMRKVRVGTVVRTKMDKTAVVEMVWYQRHLLYKKQMRRVARFYVHDPERQCEVGDLVRIQEVRPISKTKRWRLLEVMERHLVPEVRPIELESDAQIEETEETEIEETEITAEANLNDAVSGDEDTEE